MIKKEGMEEGRKGRRRKKRKTAMSAECFTVVTLVLQKQKFCFVSTSESLYKNLVKAIDLLKNALLPTHTYTHVHTCAHTSTHMQILVCTHT